MAQSSSATSGTPFPPEIVIQVLRHLPANDKSALARASLVCRWMQQELASKLYHTVTLDSPLKVEQMFSAQTPANAAVSPFTSRAQIHSLTLKLPQAQSDAPQGIDLSRLGATRPASFPHSLHLVLGAPGDLYPALLSLLTPTHLIISREPHPAFSGAMMYFPMFRYLGGAVVSAVRSWTMLRSIHLLDTYPLSSEMPPLARFIFEPVIFDEPVSITFDFSKASAATGLEPVHLQLLWMNFFTKGVTGVSKVGKLEVRVGSAEDKESVEKGKRSSTGFPLLDRTQVVVVEDDDL